VCKELKELALRKLTFLWIAPDCNSESANPGLAFSSVIWLGILSFCGIGSEEEQEKRRKIRGLNCQIC
jgi:hypothetical protein